MRVYLRWWQYTSLSDVLSLARALVVAEIAAYALDVAVPAHRPRRATTRCRVAWWC